MILQTIIYTLVITNKMTKLLTARLKPFIPVLINCSSKETKLNL